MTRTTCLPRTPPASSARRVPDAVDFDRERARAERGFVLLTERAKRAGAVRADVRPGDLTLVLLANRGVAAASAATARPASRRLVALLLRSFAATPGAGDERLPPPAPIGLDHLPLTPDRP